MYLGQTTGTPIITGLTQLVQSGAQLYTALHPPRPAGVSPNVLPQYSPQQYMQTQPQGVFGLGLDPMTLALIAGGAILVIALIMKR
jgi:hypothetical protein